MANEMGVVRPIAGEVWEKKSFPVPTIVKIVAIQDDQIVVKCEGRLKVLTTDFFLAQSFQRKEYA